MTSNPMFLDAEVQRTGDSRLGILAQLVATGLVLQL